MFKVLEAQTKDMHLWWKAFEAEWLPKPLEKETVSLIIDDNENVWYHIHLSDWIAGTFIDNGHLKAFEKQHFTRTKDAFGYKLITEPIKGLNLPLDNIDELKKEQCES